MHKIPTIADTNLHFWLTLVIDFWYLPDGKFEEKETKPYVHVVNALNKT
jgi:hypothetical protein